MHKLKDTGIGISSDLTRTQRAHQAKLKKELSDRVAAGENNLVIKYKLGVPIITSNNSKNQVSFVMDKEPSTSKND